MVLLFAVGVYEEKIWVSRDFWYIHSYKCIDKGEIKKHIDRESVIKNIWTR